MDADTSSTVVTHQPHTAWQTYAAVTAAFASVIAGVAAIGAFWVTYQQLKIANSGVAAQVSQTIGQELIEINKSFIEHPKLWKYFYDGHTIKPTDDEYPAVMALADMHLDFFDGFDDDHVRSVAGMGKDGKTWKLWEVYFKDISSTSPALCLRLSKTKTWYGETVNTIWEKHCANSNHWRDRTSNPSFQGTLRDKAARRP